MRSRSFTVKIFLCFCAVILFSVLVPCGYFLHSIRLESIDIMRAEAFREAAFIRSALSPASLRNLPSAPLWERTHPKTPVSPFASWSSIRALSIA